MSPVTSLTNRFTRSLVLDENERKRRLTRETTSPRKREQPTALKSRSSSMMQVSEEVIVDSNDLGPFTKSKGERDVEIWYDANNELTEVGDYRIVSLLGTGGFGKTYKAEKDGKYYAVKIFTTNKPEDAEYEIEMLRKISSFCYKYFSCLREVLVHNGMKIIVSDYIDGVSADQHFRGISSEVDREYEGFKLFKEMSEAVALLHQNDIVHLDIKPNNIIYSQNEQKYKLIDFGVAVDMNDINAEAQVRRSSGTEKYRSIDYSKIHYSRALNWDEIAYGTDDYAIAMSVYWLSEGRFPYDTNTRTGEYILENPIKFNHIKSNILKDLITRNLKTPSKDNIDLAVEILSFQY